jgi:hypothetical protein
MQLQSLSFSGQKKFMKKLALLLILLMGLGSQSAIAQTPDEEEKFDDAIAQFGYLSGQAFQCAAQDQGETIENDAMKVFTGITRLFGSDRAFFYAAAYGAGATDTIDTNDCSEYISQFQEAMENNALKEGQ